MPQFTETEQQVDPQANGQQHDSTEEGLPILKKPASDTTEDGLPVLKKKDGGSPSPSATSPTTKTASQPPISVSPSSLHNNIFGVRSKEDTSPIDTELFADQKGSLIDRATKKALETAKTDKEKQAVNVRKHELTSKFLDGTLDGKDVEYISSMVTPDEKFQQGLTSDDIAGAINNKTKNLRVWSNVAVMKGIDNYEKQVNDIDGQINTLKAKLSDRRLLPYAGNIESQIKNLNEQKDWLHHAMNNVYQAEKAKAVPTMVSDFKNTVLGGKDLVDVVKNQYHVKTKEEEAGLDRPYEKHPDYFVEYNPDSHTLTKESTASVLKYATDWGKKNANRVLNTQSQGGTDYGDLGNSLVNYLNTVPITEAHQRIYSDNWNKKNKEYAPLVEHQEQIRNFFTPENIKSAKAVVDSSQDKAFVLTQEKYLGKNGIITTNPEFVKMQEKLAEAVGRGEMTGEIAKKQIQTEIETNPIFQKAYKQYEKEVGDIKEKGQKLWEEFLTKGIQSSVDPNLVVYASGKVGVKGKSEAQTRVIMNQYNEGLQDVTARVLKEQSDALGLDANQRAERLGALSGSYKQAQTEMLTAWSNWFFHKTGWGGDNARMFQAINLEEQPVTTADVAKSWNWQGLKSLINPKFYASKVGGMIPVMAPAAAMTAVTEGAGLPESIGWLSSAGIFTAQDALSFREGLTNQTDRYGNRISESDADHIAADQALQEFLPNLAFMSFNLGTLSRAKAITKPTVGKAIKDAVIGAASGTPAMAVQGYLSYANNLRAQGKKTDVFDYMQDDHFATSMIDGFVGGLGLQLVHAPSNYFKSVKNWKTMIAQSDQEFNDNALYNLALQHQAKDSGNYLRDAIKLHLFNKIYASPAEKANLETLLQYSTALDKNIQAGGIDVKDVRGAYQAHNLALADLHEQWAENAKDNKNLSKIYSDQEKEFKKQAQDAMEGKGKFHYLIDGADNPIFLSDNSFKHLDANGNIKEWLKRGIIKSVNSSEDPSFDTNYKNELKEKAEEPTRKAPLEPKLLPEQAETIVKALVENRDEFSPGGESMYGMHLENPQVHEQLASEIISQAADHQGNMKDTIGPTAFNIIKPIIDEQIELAKPKVEDLPPLRDKGETKEIMGRKIEGLDLKRKAAEEINFEGKKIRADEAIDKLKEKHSKLQDIIDNCI